MSKASPSFTAISQQEASPNDKASTGNLFVISAPSGAGKTSLVNALVASDHNVKVAISHTTRIRRPEEVDGINYFFVDERQFRRMSQNNEFLEWAHVFGSYYGTSSQEARRILSSGHHLVLEIDWQGAAQIRAEMPHASSIFILPPSLGTLRDRLEKRAQDDDTTVQHRMNAAISEISHYSDFDYLLVNDNFDLALEEITDIVNGHGEHLRIAIQKKRLKPLINELLHLEQHSGR